MLRLRDRERETAKETFYDSKNLLRFGMLMLIIWLSQN